MSLGIHEPLGDYCPECEGTGSVRVIYGEDEMAAPCESCGGSGRVILLEREARDLRLIPEVSMDERDNRGDETIHPSVAA